MAIDFVSIRFICSHKNTNVKRFNICISIELKDKIRHWLKLRGLIKFTFSNNNFSYDEVFEWKKTKQFIFVEIVFEFVQIYKTRPHGNHLWVQISLSNFATENIFFHHFSFNSSINFFGSFDCSDKFLFFFGRHGNSWIYIETHTMYKWKRTKKLGIFMV